ncbi:MAG: hypothetical protein GEU87_03030 [Alphaproteobacteria bacterium]|nr:hypothetical protein [Alphaproteobacteria bacterium]
MDDADLSGSPIIFLIVGGVLLALFIYLFQSSRKSMDRAAAPRRSVAYECVATPLGKADAELRGKFPSLAALASEDGVELVRFGLFNWGELALAQEQIAEPIAVRFGAGSEVLSAELGETIKADIALPEPPTVDGGTVTFPRFAIPARGTVIFNIIVRGKGRPEAVAGTIEGSGPIRRLG